MKQPRLSLYLNFWICTAGYQRVSAL